MHAFLLLLIFLALVCFVSSVLFTCVWCPHFHLLREDSISSILKK